jgi:hypothetical protein
MVVFLKHLAEFVVAQAQVPDGFAMFGEFTQEGMMYVHRLFRLLSFKFDSLLTTAFELSQ